MEMDRNIIFVEKNFSTIIKKEEKILLLNCVHNKINQVEED